MDLTIFPGKLSGSVAAIPSKSQAHRFLICAAFAHERTSLLCPLTNEDIEATADCLRALGAKIARTGDGYEIIPIRAVPASAVLPCRESGSTLRFLLPIAGALGVDTLFQMEGRLPCRPLSPLWEEMERMGCILSRPDSNTVRCQGTLRPGRYFISGSVSSQFITGLLFALSLIPGKTELTIEGKPESEPYIAMTRAAMARFHAPEYQSPGTLTVEGDWSNAAFFLAAGAMGNSVEVTGLDPHSSQGDRIAADLIRTLDSPAVIDASDVPDLVPILSVVAAAREGAEFQNIRRLRLKESDRVRSVIEMIRALGGEARADENTLTVLPSRLTGGTVDSCGDHRIAMAAAIASTVCVSPVTILGASCVRKSYPTFFDDFRSLGGNYEFNLR